MIERAETVAKTEIRKVHTFIEHWAVWKEVLVIGLMGVIGLMCGILALGGAAWAANVVAGIVGSFATILTGGLVHPGSTFMPPPSPAATGPPIATAIAAPNSPPTPYSPPVPQGTPQPPPVPPAHH